MLNLVGNIGAIETITIRPDAAGPTEQDVTGFVVDPLGRHRFDTVDIPGDPGG